MGKLDEAEPLLRQNLVAMQARLGEDHRDTLSAMYTLALNLKRQRKIDEAMPLYRSLVELARSSLDQGDWRLGVYLLGYGRILVEQGQPDAGWPEVEAAHAIFVDTLPEGHSTTAAAAAFLAKRDPEPEK